VDAALVPGGLTAPEVLFYDGACGLCHRTVRQVVAADRAERFRFAPLQGDTFQRLVPESSRTGLPDSIVVLDSRGRLLTRSEAVLHVYRRLGGLWPVLAFLSSLVPRFLRDAVYDLVARIRSRLFAKPDDYCPLVPKELRTRFLP
jgi:predicted DCC family thiol-disulfide oxidoreductase YuxK